MRKQKYQTTEKEEDKSLSSLSKTLIHAHDEKTSCFLNRGHIHYIKKRQWVIFE